MRFLRGPNVWASVPVLEADVEGNAAAIAQRALDLERETGSRVSFCASKGYRIAIEFEEEDVALRCLSMATGAIALDLEALREFAEDTLLGPNTRALSDAAKRRGIPVRRLDRGTLLQLGHGSKQRRLSGAFTDRTSSIGENVGWDKPLAKRLLEAVGVPVPEGRRVSDAEDAWRAAQEYGGCVVVKPEAANHGRGVFIGISDHDAIARAFDSASQAAENPAVLVERFVPGSEHRVLIVNGEIVAAMRGDPLYATGDAARTITQLIDDINRDPRRGPAAECPLYPVSLNETTLAVLEAQSFTPDSVPPVGTKVLLQRNGNLSRDVTDNIHPDNHEICALAARTIGLDVAGVDLIAEDLARPLREQGGAILEVNAMPGMTMHLWPGEGQPRPVADHIVRALFPEGTDGRIPIIAVHGSGARELAAAAITRGVRTGLTCAEGTFVNGRQTRTANSIADLLLHPEIDLAICETPDALIEQEGLAFDRCTFAIFDTDPSTPAASVLAATAENVIVNPHDRFAIIARLYA